MFTIKNKTQRIVKWYAKKEKNLRLQMKNSK